MWIPQQGQAGDPEVSWRLIRPGLAVCGPEGARLGRVTRLLGDPGRDIFDGIAFRAGWFAPEQTASLADIARITERAVHVRPTAGGPRTGGAGAGAAGRRRRWYDEDGDDGDLPRRR